jgi:Icc-related predicted phosphoesterase
MFLKQFRKKNNKNNQSKMISIVSDLHLERNCTITAIKNILHGCNRRIVVISGDVCTFKTRHTLNILFQSIKPNYDKVFYVLGNHEYIGSKYTYNDTIKEYRRICSNYSVHLLENEMVIHNSLKICGTTLWVNPVDNTTKYRKKIRGLHDEALVYLKGISNVDVLITHHLPSYSLIDTRFKKNHDLYASNSDHLFLKTKLFIHGHTHRRIDAKINNTRIVCNPYVNESYFRPFATTL